MTYEPVTDQSRQDLAFERLRRAFNVHSTSDLRTPINGQQGGVIWKSWTKKRTKSSRSSLLWMNEFWLDNNEKPNIAINIPLNILDINNLGLAACDEHGNLFLCRQKLGKGHKGDRTQALPDEKFDVGWTGPEYPKFRVEGGSSPRNYHVLAALNEGPSKLLSDLRILLKSKSALTVASDVREISPDSFREFAESQSYIVPARDETLVESHHNLVVNCLACELSALGHSVSDHRSVGYAPDLYIISDKKISAIFEIKTSNDPYAIYTGIGQLLYYRETYPHFMKNNAASILVLPEIKNDRHYRALSRLGFHVLRYRLHAEKKPYGNSPQVRFLDPILPDV